MTRKSCSILLLAVAALAAGTSAPAASTWRTWWGDVAFARGTVSLSSRVPVAAAETHSALVTSGATYGDQVFSYTVTTQAQLRTGGTPNPWEVAWSMFRFRDLENYYWFIVKPNGWELGKKQGSDTQIFLATGDSPRRAAGTTYRVRIRAEGPRIRAWIDGVPVVDYSDRNPILTGAVGLYEEDARVVFSGVGLTNL